jgi:hypothetical protein
MKKTIVLTQKFRGKPAGSELTLPSQQAKVIVEILGKATYLDKSLRVSPVQKAAPPPPVPVAPVPNPVVSVPPPIPGSPSSESKLDTDEKKEGKTSGKLTLSRKNSGNSGSSSTDKDN